MDERVTIEEIKDILRKFRDERDWSQFHDPKNIASAISIEAAELQEIFLWKTKEDIEARLANDPVFKQKVEEELADIFNYCLTFANATGTDLASIAKAKILKNGEKYPVNKAKGTADKYTEL